MQISTMIVEGGCWTIPMPVKCTLTSDRAMCSRAACYRLAILIHQVGSTR